ncbi:MAG TPA: glycosyltransferase family 2 protein [Humisphaera sp.]|jgi:glycosyltransferase involved in cell wall biosynthesis|nr:glycosyltransferase family 2 protein [Humisphaera sp.]
MMTTVTIIVPTFNRAETARRAVQSALNQSHQDLEVVVIDDCSTDDTEALIGTIGDNRLRYIRQSQNTNMPASWDAGLHQARGEFIAFLGDDDFLLPDFVAHRVAAFQEDPALAAVFGRHQRMHVGTDAAPWVPQEGWTIATADCAAALGAALTTDWFITSTMYRRERMLRPWRAAQNDGFVFDVGLNARIILGNHGGVRFIPDQDVVVSVHNKQVSATKGELMLQQKATLMETLLAARPTPALARAIRNEIAEWHVTWGRALIRAGDLPAARRHFMIAAAARPLRRHTWMQFAKSYIVSLPMGRRFVAEAPMERS